MKDCRRVIGLCQAVAEWRSPRLLGGILRYRSQHPGFDLYNIDVPDKFVIDGPAPPWRGKVDGVLLGIRVDGEVEAVLAQIAAGCAPVVTMVSNIIDPRLPAVIVDARSVVELAVAELLRCGCRKLLFIAYAPSMGSRRRAEAFDLAAARTGLPHARLECQWMAQEEGGENPDENRALAELLAAGPRPVGVHTENDPVGRRVARVCESAGLRMPQDVAIVAADDSPLAFDRRPTLSSVCYPGEEIGYRAAELLDRLITGHRRPRQPILVPATEIAVRATTGGDTEPDDIARAVELIAHKACLGITVEQLAESLPFSRRTLEREFRRRLGRTPAFEIQRLRLAAAQKLLTETQFPIGRIAGMVGYAEAAAFSNAFYRLTGLWPKEYRRKGTTGKRRRGES